jgi:hypothetical protein
MDIEKRRADLAERIVAARRRIGGQPNSLVKLWE